MKKVSENQNGETTLEQTPLPGAELPPDKELDSSMEWSTISASLLERLHTQWQTYEQPFTSSVPIVGSLIARFRHAWNNVSTTWYVRPLIRQQNEFNHQVAVYLHHMTVQFQNMAQELARQKSEMTAVAAQLRAVDARLTEGDAWLIEQDREQTASLKSVAELTTQLVQMNRLLHSVNERLNRLEVEPKPDTSL